MNIESFFLSDDCVDLAYTIVDEDGYIKWKWISHPKMKGSGVFDNRLSKANFMVLETVEVEANYRRKGIGRMMIETILSQKVLSLSHIKTSPCGTHRVYNVYAWPTQLGTASDAYGRRPLFRTWRRKHYSGPIKQAPGHSSEQWDSVVSERLTGSAMPCSWPPLSRSRCRRRLRSSGADCFKPGHGCFCYCIFQSQT